MILKLILLYIAICISLFGAIKDIETKINKNKKEFVQTKKSKIELDNMIKNLAIQINKEEESYNKIVAILEDTNAKIFLNRLKLDNAKQEVSKLKETALSLEEQKKQIEKRTINFIIKRYSMTMGLEQADKTTTKELIDKEVYSVILENVKQELLDLNINYLKVNRNKRLNQDKITALEKFIQKQHEIQQKYIALKKEQEIILDSLTLQHKQYQKSLQSIIDRQNKLTDLLGNLNILKKKEIQAEQLRIKKEKEKLAKEKKELEKKRKIKEKQALLAKLQQLRKDKKSKKKIKTKEYTATKQTKKTKQLTKRKPTKQIKFLSKKDLQDDINIEVKKIGSSAKGIRIAKYVGKKTIAPLKSYTIVKKFGTYYDPVYKMKLFNESVSMKTKRANAKVFSVLKGKIVYAKKNAGLLDNVVIVKHKGNLHTIYSHLDKISPTLKVGKWIPKGYVVGRVNNILQFQATKNSKYIDPTKLFK